MRWTNRSFLAIAISSLLFGGIAVPYIYLALVWRTDPLRIVTWLAPCTIFLGLILVSRSWIEEKLAHQWGFFFRFLIVTLTIGALIYSFFFRWALSSITIFVPPVVDWFYLIVNSGIATLIAFVIIIAARPSRLEKIIAAKVSGYGTSPLLYRSAAYSTLLVGFIFASFQLYRYYLYTDLCVGIVQPECQVLFGKMLH
jgi:hypothetical protein